MKKTVAGDDGGVGGVGGGGGSVGGDRKSLRNRRRRSAAAAGTGAQSTAAAAEDDNGAPAPAQTVPLPAATTVTSGALQRLEAADDWLFTDWLDGGATTSTYRTENDATRSPLPIFDKPIFFEAFLNSLPYFDHARPV